VAASPGGASATTTGALTATVAGLTNGQAYTFTVTATTAVGTGIASAVSGSVTPGTVPARPVIVSAVAGVNSVTVTWTAPDNGGLAISGYTVTATPGGGATSATVTGLANGTAYTFTVHATNAIGSSDESDPSSSATPYTVPDAPG